MLSSLLNKHPTSLPISFLVLIILIPYWKLTTMTGFLITDDIFTSDIMNDAFPYRFYLGEALKSGHLPLWYPPVYGGFPLLARSEAGIAYPLNLLLFGFLSPYVALNLVILLTLVVAAVSMYLYAREIEVNLPGALIASVSFAYSGFMVAHLKHLSTVNAACWFPLGLFFIERAFKQNDTKTTLERLRPLMYLSLVIGMQNLAGHTQTAYYSGLAYGAYFLFRSFSTRKRVRVRKKEHTDKIPRVWFLRDPRTLWFAVAVVVAVGVSAIQILPTYELVSLSQRSGGVTFEYASSYSYDPSNIKTFFSPYANGDIGNATYRGKSIFWEDYGYVGVVTMLLALYAVVVLWKKPFVRFFSILAVVAYFLVLGPNTPVYEAVFHVVPGMKFFRFPTRFLLIVDASLGILAGFGATQLLSRFGRSGEETGNQTRGSSAGYILLALVIIDLLYFQMRQNPIVEAGDWLAPVKTVRKIREDQGLFRIYSPGASETHKAAFNMAKGWQGSLQPYIDQREFIQPSSNVLYDISTADGYAQLTPNYVVDVWGDQNRGGLIYETAAVQQNVFMVRPAFAKIISMFNIKYLLTPWPVQGDSLERMETVANSVFMYRNPNVMSRAFFVADYKLAQNSDAAKAILLSQAFNPRKQAILYRRPQLASGSETSLNAVVSVEKYRTNEVIIRVTTHQNGLLVLSDTYYPGWRAFVDGTEKEILRANICQRAVEVTPGEHEVRFVFDSFPVKAGFGVSVASLLVVTAMLLASRRKGEPRG